jgi:hypothetical protein
MAEDSATKDETTARHRPPRMRRAAVEKKAAELQRARDALDAQLRDLNAVKRTWARKDDARRKIIAGALALEHLKANPQDQVVPVRRLLAEYVKDRDRRLFEDLEIAWPADEPAS